MKTKQYIICVIFVIIFSFVLSLGLYVNDVYKDNLKRTLANKEVQIINETVEAFISEPLNIFAFIIASNYWQPVSALQYSDCYRHTNNETKESNYIFCKSK